LNEFDQVIDARGVTAGVVNAFALRAYWTIRAEDYIAYSAAKIQIYFDPALGVNGYGWIFPVDQKDGVIKLNLGVIVFKDEYQKIKQNIIRLFQNFVERNQITQALSQKTICQQQAQAFPLAVGQPNHQVTQGTILKIGDAANLADPVNGEGIGNAILSGMAVAQAINMSGSPETAAANWQHLYDMQFKPHIEAGLRVRRLRRYWFMNPLLIRLMQRHQGLADQVGASAIAGLIGYDELGFKPLTKTFLFNSLSI
jgi:flavin-dependent dehydrogenase